MILDSKIFGEKLMTDFGKILTLIEPRFVGLVSWDKEFGND